MLPEIPHLQALVLGCLVGKDDVTSNDLMAAIARYGAQVKGPAFYQLMNRMLDEKLVDRIVRPIPGFCRQANYYTITKKGLKAVVSVFEHYQQLQKGTP